MILPAFLSECGQLIWRILDILYRQPEDIMR